MKNIVRVLSGSIITLVAYFLLGTVPNAFAAGPYTCTWTGGGSDSNFSTAANWSGCNSAAPQPADNDNLIFNAVSTTSAMNNDITGLALTNITISGATTGQVIISGNAISLSGGITDTATGSAVADAINTPLTLTADQTFDVSTSQDDLSVNGNITFGTNNLTVNAGQITSNQIALGGVLSGTGGLTITGSGNEMAFINASPSYSGTVTISNGVSVELDSSINALGTGTINVSSGGLLMVEDSGATDTLPNNLNLAGTISSCLNWVSPGNGGPGVGHFGVLAGCTKSATTLTLSGTVTLTGNSSAQNGNPSSNASTATINMTGTYNSAGFNFIATPATATNLEDNGVVISSGITSSGSASSSSASTAAAPKAPNTGAALTSSDYAVILATTTIAATGLVYLARKYKSLANNK